MACPPLFCVSSFCPCACQSLASEYRCGFLRDGRLVVDLCLTTIDFAEQVRTHVRDRCFVHIPNTFQFRYQLFCKSLRPLFTGQIHAHTHTHTPRTPNTIHTTHHIPNIIADQSLSLSLPLSLTIAATMQAWCDSTGDTKG